MTDRKQRVVFTVIGICFFIVSLIDLLTALFFLDEHFAHIFWFCNIALFLLAYGFILRKPIVFSGVFIGALVVQLPWDIDFIYQLVTGVSLLPGLADYMFQYNYNFVFFLELDHLLIIPLSLYGIVKTGFHRRGWIFAFVVGLAITGAGFLFSMPEDNVNCALRFCLGKGAFELQPISLYYLLKLNLILLAGFFLVDLVIRFFMRWVKVIRYVETRNN